MQAQLPCGPAPAPRAIPASAVSVCEEAGAVILSSGKLLARLQRGTGRLLSFSREGKTLICGADPAFSRPPTGLDCREGWGWRSQTALFDSVAAEVTNYQVMNGPQGAAVRFELAVSTPAPYPITAALTYRLAGGVLHIEYAARLPEMYAAIPRVGLRFDLDKALDRLKYFGWGPVESYSDRLAGGGLGVFASTVQEEHFAFIPPSENGGHEQTRWLTLSDADGCGIAVRGRMPFHFDARFHSVQAYRQAGHEHELPAPERVFLHIDAAHSPIGGNMSWSTGVDRQAMLMGGSYYTAFEIAAL